MVIRRGTPGDDRLVGTDVRDELRGLAGDDTLIGRKGNDLLAGGLDGDVLWGGGENADSTIGLPAPAGQTPVNADGFFSGVWSIAPGTAISDPSFGWGYGTAKGQIGMSFDDIAGVRSGNLTTPGSAVVLQLATMTLNEDPGAPRPEDPTGTIPWLHPTEGTNAGAHPEGVEFDIVADLNVDRAVERVIFHATPTIAYGAVNDPEVDYQLAFAPQRVTFDNGAVVDVDIQDIVFTGNGAQAVNAVVSLVQEGSKAPRASDGADELRGGDGGDTIHAGLGPDLLIGGADGDILYGEAGNDTFRFGQLGDIAGDRIKDFHKVERDLVDLSAIDASPGAFQPGDQAFAFDDGDAILDPGEVRVVHPHARNETIVQLKDEAGARAELAFDGFVPLGAEDFLL